MGAPPPLEEVLAEAKQLGFLGPGPVRDHLAHAQGFVGAVSTVPGRFLDLGSGGGVPGLVLALAWPDAAGVLLDGSVRRTSFLRRAVITLGLQARVEVVTERAERAGHDPHLRAQVDVVCARGFGPPEATVEYGGAFLRPGGVLLVSDPPGGADRWSLPLLASFGFQLADSPGSVRRLQLVGEYPLEAPARRRR